MKCLNDYGVRRSFYNYNFNFPESGSSFCKFFLDSPQTYK